MSEIRGIGLDLCSIPRMAEMLTHAHFLDRTFTPQEQAYIRSRGAMGTDSAAAMWCAKEAACKAFGLGITLPLTEIEILHNDCGAPFYVLHGQAKQLLQGGQLLLSISHEEDTAAAMCVWSI